MSESREVAVIKAVRNSLMTLETDMRAVLPAHIEPKQFMRVAQTAIQFGADLTECTQRSLVGACVKLAEMGLMPDGHEAALVAYNTKIRYRENGEWRERWEKQAKAMPMVAGIRDLVMRSGMVKNWKVRLVRAGDVFDHEDGDEEYLKHKPCHDDDSPITHVYSIAYFENGAIDRHVMTIGAVEKIRRRSRSADKGPWVTDFDEMVKKTCLRQHSKALPKAKGEKDQSRFMGAIRALDEAEDVLALNGQHMPPAAMIAPGDLVREAAAERLAAAVENAVFEDIGGDEPEATAAAPAAAPEPEQAPDPAPKAPRKRRTPSERLAEAEGRAPTPAKSSPPKGPIEIISQEGVSIETREFLSADEGRDLAFERETRAQLEHGEGPTGFRDAEFVAGDDEAEDASDVQAYRGGWRDRFSGKPRRPSAQLCPGPKEAAAWLAGYDMAQKVIDLGNAPQTPEASEAMLARQVDRHFSA